MRIGRHCLIVLERTLLAAAPDEGCALLLGSRQGQTLVIEHIWPCCNRWQPAAERRRRFLLDPREQLLAQRWARGRHCQVLGAAHSHPESPPRPSASDRRLCLGPTLMLIRSGLPLLPQPLRAWWLPEPSHPDGSGPAPEPLALDLELAAEDLGE